METNHDPFSNRRGVAARRAEAMQAWILRAGRAHWICRLRWRRLVLVAGAFALAAYLGAASAAYGFLRYHRQIEQLALTDLVLPWRWQNTRVARGNHSLAAARRFTTEQKWREALLYSRTGLALAPANRDGRLLLAEIATAMKRPEFSRQILIEGIPYHEHDATYLQTVLTFLLQQQDDNAVVRLARRSLPRQNSGSATERVLGFAAAAASLARGNFDQAEDFLRAVPHGLASREGRLLRARIERDRGYRELAALQFHALALELPDDAEVHRDRVELLRRLGRQDEARRCCLAFQMSHAESVAARMDLLRACHDAGDVAGAAREIAAWQRDFADDPQAGLELAGFGAGSGDAALVRRIDPRGDAAPCGRSLCFP